MEQPTKSLIGLLRGVDETSADDANGVNDAFRK
jgi:hypothetical protein